MSLLSTIYNASPVALQNLWVSAYGLYWQKRRYGGIFTTELNAYKEREQYSATQWQAYQTMQLQKMLLHAHDHVPYYKQLFQEQGISRLQLSQFQLSDLHTIPFLEKTTLKQYGETTLLSQNVEPGGAFYSSSGSTGTPTKIRYSLAMHQRLSAAYEARVRHWAGVNRFQSRGMIGGRRVLPEGEAHAPYYRINWVEKQLYMSAYHISAQTAPHYLEGIRRFGCEYLVGYAMSHFFLARFIDEAGLKAPQMKAVLTSSEKLTQEMRDLLARVYQCKVYDAWSGVENCGLISASEYGQLLVSPDVGILEMIKADGTPCLPGESGEIVCTGFLNYDQPLIRYKIGDIVRLSENQRTKCGRNFPVIDEILGRVEDVVVGKDGREMVRFHGIFVDLPNVIEGQIIQKSLDDFIIKIVTTGQLTQQEKNAITSRMTSQLGKINVQIEVVSEIPKGPNGKFKAVISFVKRVEF